MTAGMEPTRLENFLASQLSTATTRIADAKEWLRRNGPHRITENGYCVECETKEYQQMHARRPDLDALRVILSGPRA